MAESTDSEPEKAAQFEARSPTIQHIIKLAAEEPDLERWGVISEIADEADCTNSHVSHTIEKYDHLVDWYRTANLDPLEPGAVEEAYEDETMAEMAEAQPVADGAGGIQFDITMSGQQAFRAMKLLPGDLGMTIFQQILTEADDLDAETVAALYEQS